MRRTAMSRILCESALRSAAVLVALTFACCDGVIAADPELVRVEEDWLALIIETDEGNTTPQLMNVISPDQSLSGTYGLIELNHSTYPTFSRGGLQIQTRRGDTLLSANDYADGVSLRHDYDRLEYTVYLSVEQNEMYVGVSNVRSKTWGSLNLPQMRVQMNRLNRSLADYSPDYSAANTSVLVGAPRLATFCQVRTRYIYSNGDIVTDTTMRYPERFRDQSSYYSLDDFSCVVGN